MVLRIGDGIQSRIDHLDFAAQGSCIRKAHLCPRNADQIAEGTDRGAFFKCQHHRLVDIRRSGYTYRTSRSRDQLHLFRQDLADPELKIFVGMRSAHLHDANGFSVIRTDDLQRALQCVIHFIHHLFYLLTLWA